jgi:NAD(P)-dependent dehydrogenase (short-subunit alcohol dehydrogenase family)
MSQGRVAGKVALVTGAASGIGRATALLLAQEGAAVVCADRNAEGTTQTARTIQEHGGRALAMTLDVTSEDDWETTMTRTVAVFGTLDILVNSAGIAFAAPVPETSLADWRRVLAVNLDGVFLGTRQALRAMRARGGSVINVSSASGIRASAGACAYSVSKAAVCMFGKVTAKECREQGIPVRVNTVCPGGVKTPLWATMPFFQELIARTGSEESAFRAMAGDKPGNRFAEPDEIARAILYLASDESAFVTGLDLIIDAGYVL